MIVVFSGDLLNWKSSIIVANLVGTGGGKVSLK